MKIQRTCPRPVLFLCPAPSNQSGFLPVKELTEPDRERGAFDEVAKFAADLRIAVVYASLSKNVRQLLGTIIGHV